MTQTNEYLGKSLGFGPGLPSRIYHNTTGPNRASPYGEQYVWPIAPWRHALAYEGTYFVARNNTNDASTTLAGHPAPVLADADDTMTKPLIFCRNTAATSELRRACLDFIEITVITAGGSGTSANWAAQLDTGATRYSSGTVETLTAINPNMQSSATPSLVTLAGPVVVGAESANVRRLGFDTIRPSIEIAGDKYLFAFGRDPDLVASAAAAAVRNFIINLPAVELGPADQFLLALYAPSQAAAGVYKVRMGWWER
jgi:hypothetical protein